MRGFRLLNGHPLQVVVIVVDECKYIVRKIIGIARALVG